MIQSMNSGMSAGTGAAVLAKVREEPDVVAARQALDSVTLQRDTVDKALATNFSGRMSLVPDIAEKADKQFRDVQILGKFLGIAAIGVGILIGTQHVFGPASGVIALGIEMSVPWVTPWLFRKAAQHQANQVMTTELTARKTQLDQQVEGARKNFDAVEGAALQRLFDAAGKTPQPSAPATVALEPEQVTINGISVPRRHDESGAPAVIATLHGS